MKKKNPTHLLDSYHLLLNLSSKVDLAEEYLSSDPASFGNHLRNSLETILISICQAENKKLVTEKTTNEAINVLRTVLPGDIHQEMRAVQTGCNVLVHDGAKHADKMDNKTLSEKKRKQLLKEFKSIFKWFLSKYHRRFKIAPVEFTVFTSDLIYKSISYESSLYINNRTVVLVLGTHTLFELFCRPIATVILYKINTHLKFRSDQRAVITTDCWYEQDHNYKNKTTIYFGFEIFEKAHKYGNISIPDSLINSMQSDIIGSIKILKESGHILLLAEHNDSFITTFNDKPDLINMINTFVAETHRKNNK